MSVNLKPCPWCGSDEIIKPDKSPFYCLDCNASGPEDDWVPGVTWNTRAPDPAVAVLEAEVARLRGLVEDAYFEGWADATIADLIADDIRDVQSDWDKSDTLVSLNPAPSEKEAG